MDDLKGRTGRADDTLVVGKYGESNLNDNWQCLIDLCQKFPLKILKRCFFIRKHIGAPTNRKLKLNN